MRVLVISRDKYLIRKIELELGESVTLGNEYREGSFDAAIYDCDSGLPLPEFKGNLIMISRNSETEGALTLPLPIGEIKRRLLLGKEKSALILSDNGKSVTLFGKQIKLTSHEYALLSLLVSGGDSYTSREEISRRVWGEASDSLINVYVHYLREKLETNGEKIIISSRKYGYKINEKYLSANAVKNNL